MKQMNPREKNLALLVLIISTMVAWGAIKKQMKKEMDRINASIAAAEAQVEQSKAALVQLTTPHAVKNKVTQPAPTFDGVATLNILRDITMSKEAGQIRISRLERVGDKGYRVIADGSFSQMMHFLSYLERMNGRFSVTSGELSKLQSEQKDQGDVVLSQPKREIRATLNLSLRG